MNPRTGRRLLVAALVAGVAVGIVAIISVGLSAVDDLTPAGGWSEFDRRRSPDGAWTIVLEQMEPFGFGSTPVRVLLGGSQDDPTPRARLRVGNDGRLLTSCGVTWFSDTVRVACVGDEGGPEIVMLDLKAG